MANLASYLCTIAADVGSGTLKCSEGLTVDSTPTIVPIAPATPAGTIGKAWQLEIGQFLQLSFTLHIRGGYRVGDCIRRLKGRSRDVNFGR